MSKLRNNRKYQSCRNLNWIFLKPAFAVVTTDNICGRSLSSDHSGYCVIK
jgi:hypothetical protein